MTGDADPIARAQRGELLAPADLRAIFGIGRAQFSRLAKAGAFDIFHAKPAIGRRRYAGALVARYLNGDAPAYVSTFGKRGTR
jgi:hypothetical protein